MAPVTRITSFKVKNRADVKPMLEKYSTMKQDAKKDGKQYILEASAGETVDDPRNQGYTLTAILKFSSVDDMKYYDEQDEAHAALKAAGKGKVDPPPLVIYFEESA